MYVAFEVWISNEWDVINEIKCKLNGFWDFFVAMATFECVNF